MDLKLNIYDENGEITKTYTTTEFDLMWGTIEDLMSIVKIDKINDNDEIFKMVYSALPQVTPLLKQIFHGVTDEELRNVKVKELVPVIVEAFKFAFTEIGKIGNNSKN